MSAPCDTVCKDQVTFNRALDTYQEEKENEMTEDLKKNRGAMIAVLIIMIIFIIWAVMLALKVKDPEHRTLHVFLALLTSPLYILSYVLSHTQRQQ